MYLSSMITIKVVMQALEVNFSADVRVDQYSSVNCNHMWETLCIYWDIGTY